MASKSDYTEKSLQELSENLILTCENKGSNLFSQENFQDDPPINSEECSSLSFMDRRYDKSDEPITDMTVEEFQSIWQRNNEGSLDLEEKLTMTGSYSEILESQPSDSGTSTVTVECGQNANNQHDAEGSSRSLSGKHGIKEFPRVTAVRNCKAFDNVSTEFGFRNEYPCDDSVQYLARDLSEKSSISSQSSKRREPHLKCVNPAPCLPKSLLHPVLPLIDPMVISDLEDHARNIATSMDTLIENLTGTLHSISALSVECVETYRDAVCKTCDAVDSNIKSMYQLMAKCEELSKSMKPMYKLQDQIKEIRRLLDLFESAVYSGGT